MTQKPNIVFIVVDDMGYGDFGLFNDGILQTPVLDQLVTESICLTQHYSGSPVCAPARASLLTGRYPHRTGAIDTLEGRGLDRIALRETTIADIFKSSGYVTGLVGKWHSGALDPRYHPLSRGFDEFVGFSGGWQDYFNWRLDYNRSYRKSDDQYLTNVFTDEAINFIKRHRNEPFFLHLAYNAPHFPFQAPEELIKPFRETGKYTEAVCRIYAMISCVDQCLGMVLKELHNLGLEENTIVLFTSDNGPQFGGDGEMCTTRFNCGFNGAKGLVYEGGIRVPMIVRWPNGFDGGRILDDMVHFVDWFPTLMAAAGLDFSPVLPLDGQNVLPFLRGDRYHLETRRFWQWNRYSPTSTSNAAMRDGDWKLVRPAIDEAMVVSQEDLEMDHDLKYHPERFDDILRTAEPSRHIPAPPPPKLFNIAQDPKEEQNLAEVEPYQLTRMQSELETWFEEVEAERRQLKTG